MRSGIGLLRSGLRADDGPAATPDDHTGVRALAGDVAHALFNPLQVISLQLEQSGDQSEAMTESIQRAQDALDIVTRFAELGLPRPEPGQLGTVVESRLDALAEAGAIERGGVAAAAGRSFLFDATQVGQAIEDIARVLAALSASAPAQVRARLDEGGQIGRIGCWLEAPEAEVDAEALAHIEARVVWSPDASRHPTPGLLLARTVAGAHGGALQVAPAPAGGCSIGLFLPLRSEPSA